jgi:hypothetical protein
MAKLLSDFLYGLSALNHAGVLTGYVGHYNPAEVTPTLGAEYSTTPTF